MGNHRRDCPGVRVEESADPQRREPLNKHEGMSDETDPNAGCTDGDGDRDDDAGEGGGVA